MYPVRFFSISLLISCLIIGVTGADLTVRFLDVGEGDAVLLQEEGKNMLIDGGTKDSRNLTLDYMRYLNITRLDAVLLTGPDEGRTGAMTTILNHTPAAHLFLGEWNSTEPSYLDLLTKLDEDNTEVTRVSPGDPVPFSGELEISLLNGAQPEPGPGSGILVPLITYHSVRFLLMGDAPTLSGDVRAQVIRVGDHGSRRATDAAFIHAVSPEIAVISTGSGKGEGPEPDTINLLESNGASVLRTDTDGVIIIDTDGKEYQVGKMRLAPYHTISLVSVVETRAPAQSGS